MQRHEAPNILRSLFPDEGLSLLGEGGKSSWEEALAALPDAVFTMKGAHHPGITVLTLARDLWNRAGDLRMATAATRGLMRYHVQNSGNEHPDALAELGALGMLAQRAGRKDEGLDLLEQAWHGLRSVVGGRDLRLAVVAGNLGLQYARTDRLEDAEHLLEIALKIREKAAPATVANVAGQLGEVRLRQGKVDAGLDNLRAAWLASLDHLGEQHGKTIGRVLTLARALNQAKRWRESCPLWRDLYQLAQRTGNPEQRAVIGFSFGQALYHTHKRDQAIRLLDEALLFARSRTDANHEIYQALPEWLSLRAQVEVDKRQPSLAEGFFQEAVEAEIRISGPDSADTARRLATVGTLIGKMGRTDEAVGYLDGASSLLASQLGHQHPWTKAAAQSLVELLAQKVQEVVAHDRPMARELIKHALQSGAHILGFDHASVRRIQALAAEHHLSPRAT